MTKETAVRILRTYLANIEQQLLDGIFDDEERDEEGEWNETWDADRLQDEADSFLHDWNKSSPYYLDRQSDCFCERCIAPYPPDDHVNDQEFEVNVVLPASAKQALAGVKVS